MTTWLSAAAFARLRAIRPRRARAVLAGWEAQRGKASVPTVRRVQSRRGRPALEVLAADVAALYAVDIDDLALLAA